MPNILGFWKFYKHNILGFFKVLQYLMYNVTIDFHAQHLGFLKFYNTNLIYNKCHIG